MPWTALARLSPHSFRAGCITALARAALPERDIMAHSRHASAGVMRTYIRASGVTAQHTATALWGPEET